MAWCKMKNPNYLQWRGNGIEDLRWLVAVGVTLLSTVTMGTCPTTGWEAETPTTQCQPWWSPSAIRDGTAQVESPTKPNLQKTSIKRVVVTMRSYWIYRNAMLMSWPETTKHTNFLLMTQLFFFVQTPEFFSLQWYCYLQAKSRAP